MITPPIVLSEICNQRIFEKADAEYAELSQKKQILHMDKDKIEKVPSAKLLPEMTAVHIGPPFRAFDDLLLQTISMLWLHLLTAIKMQARCQCCLHMDKHQQI
jgi:hypothetical protein